MKRTILSLLLCFLLLRGSAQLDTAYVHQRISQCADSLAAGFLRGDWELYAKYTYPPLIGAIGGKEAFIKKMKESFDEIPDTSWKRYEPGMILQVVKTTYDIQAVVELHSLIEWQGLRITSTHHLIAESWNGGQHWTFFDTQNDLEKTRQIKRDLSPLLQVPPKQEKVEAR